MTEESARLFSANVRANSSANSGVSSGNLRAPL